MPASPSCSRDLGGSVAEALDVSAGNLAAAAHRGDDALSDVEALGRVDPLPANDVERCAGRARWGPGQEQRSGEHEIGSPVRQVAVGHDPHALVMAMRSPTEIGSRYFVATSANR